MYLQENPSTFFRHSSAPVRVSRRTGFRAMMVSSSVACNSTVPVMPSDVYLICSADILLMVLSDVDIAEALAQGRLVIDPLDPSDVQPCSIDLHLHPSYRRFVATSVIDLGDVQEGHTTLY